MNESPQHQIHDPIDQALCADIAAYLRSIDKYFPDFDRLPDVKAVRKLTAWFICVLENKYLGTDVTAGMMLAMYDLHGHLIEDEQPIEPACWAQPLLKETEEIEMLKNVKPLPRTKPDYSRMTCREVCYARVKEMQAKARATTDREERENLFYDARRLEWETRIMDRLGCFDEAGHTIPEKTDDIYGPDGGIKLDLYAEHGDLLTPVFKSVV